MKIYRVQLKDIDGNYQPWRIAPQSFSVYYFDTSDRRLARRVVRLARRMGFGVSFSHAIHGRGNF